MFKWKIESFNEVDSGVSTNCCEAINDSNYPKGIITLQNFKDNKWAKVVKDGFKFPMSIDIKNNTITLKYSDYKTSLELFAAFTLLRYAYEHKKVVDEYYTVIKIVKGIDPLHAFYVAHIRSGCNDTDRGVMEFDLDSSYNCFIPKILTVDQMHKAFNTKMIVYEICRVFCSTKHLTDKQATELSGSKKYLEFYNKLKKLSS